LFLELVQGVTTGSLKVKLSSRYHDKREVGMSPRTMTAARRKKRLSKWKVVKWTKAWIQVYTRKSHSSMYTYHRDLVENICYRNLKKT